MSILKRVGKKTLVKGTPPVPAIPPWTEYVADPPATQSTQNGVLAFGVMGGLSAPAAQQLGSQQQPLPSSGGGSMSGSASYSYSATSYNGVPGNYILKVYADGSYEVVRR